MLKVTSQLGETKKTIMRYHFTSTRMAIIIIIKKKKRLVIVSVDDREEKLESSYTAGGIIKCI